MSAVWLQIGSDVELLREGLRFIRKLEAERGLNLRLRGSLLLPSKALLAQFRVRPWGGVFLSDNYVSAEGLEPPAFRSGAGCPLPLELRSEGWPSNPLLRSPAMSGGYMEVTSNPSLHSSPRPPLRRS